MEKTKKYKKNDPSEEFIKVKHRGKIYTPDYLVNEILDQGKYIFGNINKKHVIDNSCGDGQFMIQIVNRYCKDYLEKAMSLEQLKNELETYIHAIEIEEDELVTCKERCSKVAEIYGIYNVNWNFENADTLKIEKYNGKMDFVVGNPPYVRVHNLDEDFGSVKKFLFGKEGMTDLYIVFYEIGLKMLNGNGILTYITPSSFFTSVAGTTMRNYIMDNQLLESLCDLKHFQPFNAITYTTIVTLNKSDKFENVKYYEFDEEKLKPIYIDTLNMSDYCINKNFYFAKIEKLNLLKKIIYNKKTADVSIKNGYATLADKIFMNDFDFDSEYIIPVVKASRGKWTKAFFPYDENGKIIKEEEIKKDEKLYNYLLAEKEVLLKRSTEKNSSNNWFAYGRSQAISDTFKDKIAINTLIKKSSDLKIVDVNSGRGIYSGLYILSETIEKEKIKKALLDSEFGEYISLLGKYKNGGCYTFSSRDVKYYLDYKLGEEEELMLNNEEFLKAIKESFAIYLSVGTSRSTAKLKPLHGHIAQDLKEKLGDGFTIQSQGYEADKEGTIEGRYYPKKVDITVNYKGKPVAGYAVKFVMRNYSQNSNNYFENMLGETANLRSSGIPYFQIFIIFDKVPYYKKGGEFSKYDIISEHNLEKYLKLSGDNPDIFFHAPDKTLVALISLKEKEENYRFEDENDYAEYYTSILKDKDIVSYSKKIDDKFGNAVILNNYRDFIERTCHMILGKMKK